MNHTPDADPAGQSSPEPPPPGTTPPPTGSAFFTWLRNLGVVRGRDRWFAGVAGGIAARTGLDPMLVRGIFVVLALLGGPGILLYLLGWLLLPDFTGRIHVEEIFRGRASAGVLTTAIILAVVVFIPAVLSIVIPGVHTPFAAWGWGAWGVLGLPDWLSATLSWIAWIAILVFGGLWLRKVMLERGRAQQSGSTTAPGPAQGEAQPGSAPHGATSEAHGSAPGPHGSTPDPAAPTPPGAAGFTAQTTAFADRSEEFAHRFGEQAGAWGQRAGETAARWGDEVGKQADAWSARYAEHHDATKLGAGHTILTLALALLAAGGAAAWAFSTEPILPFASGVHPAAIAAIAAGLAVLAISLIVAGIRGRHTGWVGFLSFLGVLALLVTVVLPWGTRFQPFGTMHVTGGSVPGAVLLAGSSEVDLTTLRPGDSDLVVWQLAGRSEIELPTDTPALVTVRMLAGQLADADGDGEHMAGPFLNRTVAVNVPDRGTQRGIPRVTVYMLAGSATLIGAVPGTDEDREQLKLDAQREAQREAERQAQEDARRAAEADARDARSERATELEAEIARVDWLLENPDITEGKREGLERQREALTQKLDRELEGAR